MLPWLGQKTQSRGHGEELLEEAGQNPPGAPQLYEFFGCWRLAEVAVAQNTTGEDPPGVQQVGQSSAEYETGAWTNDIQRDNE